MSGTRRNSAAEGGGPSVAPAVTDGTGLARARQRFLAAQPLEPGQALAADLPAVLTILTENQGRPSDPQQAVWERVLATTDLTVYLAETGAEAVGTAGMLLMPHLTYDCRPTAFIEAVVVRYAHRRRGVATPLLQQARKDARAACCRKIQLLSHKRHSHDGAHDLYRAMGFTPEAEGFRLYLDP